MTDYSTSTRNRDRDRSDRDYDRRDRGSAFGWDGSNRDGRWSRDRDNRDARSRRDERFGNTDAERRFAINETGSLIASDRSRPWVTL